MDLKDFSYDVFLEDHLSFRDDEIETYTSGFADEWVKALKRLTFTLGSKFG